MIITISSWYSISEQTNKEVDVDLTDFSCWEDIETYLEEHGFDLQDEDAELCMVSYRNIDILRYVLRLEEINVENFVKTFYDSQIMEYDYNRRAAMAFIEARNLDDFMERVSQKGTNWSTNIYLYSRDLEDFGREIFEQGYYDIPEKVKEYVDYERYAEDLLAGGTYEETSDYIIEITD